MDENLSDNILTLQDEEGNDIEFEWLDTIEMDGSEYYVMIPCDEDAEEAESVGVIIMKVVEGENGDLDLVTVEDEEEGERVFEIFINNTEKDDYDDSEDPEQE